MAPGALTARFIPARDENDSPVSSQRCGRLIRSARCRLAGERSMGAAVAVTRSELTPAQLRAAACASEEPAQVRRLLAIALVLEGVPRQQAAAQCGMDRQTLPDWVHRYNEGGVAAAILIWPDRGTGIIVRVEPRHGAAVLNRSGSA